VVVAHDRKGLALGAESAIQPLRSRASDGGPPIHVLGSYDIPRSLDPQAGLCIILELDATSSWK
jgi:hypothetical protein